MARTRKDFVDSFFQEDGSSLNVANDTYKRNWFLCVNEGAQCYANFANIVESLGYDTDRWVHYAYILHDKDAISEVGYNRLLDDSCNNNNQTLFDRLNGYEILPENLRTKERYAIKPRHYHLLICFQDAKSWSRVKKYFPGAHLQVCNSVGLCFKYLTHQTDDCIKKGKTQYAQSDIVMDSTGYDFFVNVPYCTKSFEVFDPSMIGKYVFVDGLRHYIDFCDRFSPVQVQRWIASINSFCEVRRLLVNDSAGLFDYYWDDDCTGGNNGLHVSVSSQKVVTMQQIMSLIKTNPSSVKLEEYLSHLRFTPYGEVHYIRMAEFGVELNPFEAFMINKFLPDVAQKYGIENVDLDLAYVV